GITNGTSPTTFDPYGTVTRWQMALFLQRLASGWPVKVTGFTDNFNDTRSLSADKRAAIGWLANSGLTTGVAPGLFDPNGFVTRGQMVTFLDRLDLWLVDELSA
ncbi:MAG: S-layer homology domain-containing protein, partial [Acidimicrobiales bacterium]